MEIAVQTMTSYSASLELAQWAEAEGLVGFAVADHYLTGLDDSQPVLDQLTLLGGIARETSRIELATLVSPLTFRHPAVLLKTAVTLDEMSDGRFSLGVGAGWMEREHEAFGLPFPPTRERFDRLEECLAYLRAGLDPDASGFEGDYYRLEAGFSPAPLPRRLRLIVGGAGKRRTPSLAGRFADEFNLFPSDDAGMAERVETARQAAVEAGRDPDALLLSTAFPPVLGRSEAEFEEQLLQMAAARNREPDLLRQRLEALGIPHGPPSQVSEGVARLREVGICRIYLQVAFRPLKEVARSVEILRAALS